LFSRLLSSSACSGPHIECKYEYKAGDNIYAGYNPISDHKCGAHSLKADLCSSPLKRAHAHLLLVHSLPARMLYVGILYVYDVPLSAWLQLLHGVAPSFY
jgi:hypothetical protein